jgi:hypothetical protein
MLNQREGERGNRGEYRSQSWVENTNKTLKGLSHEIDFKTFDKNLQNLA